MFTITFADITEIQAMNGAFGRDSALAEVRRRWRGLTDKSAPGVLDRILATSGEPEPTPTKKPKRRKRVND